MWGSAIYVYGNIPLIIISNLFYLLFLKAFFADITDNKIVINVFRLLLLSIPILFVFFVVLTSFQMSSQLIYYTVQLASVIPAIAGAYILLKNKVHFAALVANGLLCSIIGTCLTVFMNILRDKGVHNLFTEGYPLFFVRLGILGDMIFFLAAILKKWHFQGKQLAIEKIESQLALERFRKKISGELHDDIGSTLSGITMYSYMIKDLLQSGQCETAKQSLNIIQRSADEMTQNLGDLVWTIKPRQDNVQKLIERLEEYATAMASAKGMLVIIDMMEKKDDLQIPRDSRRNIYLLCKEAINNSGKYSEAAMMKISITRKKEWLEFRVADNEKGFDIEHVKKGNGLINMGKRADEMGSKLVIESTKDTGAIVSFQYKIT